MRNFLIFVFLCVGIAWFVNTKHLTKAPEFRAYTVDKKPVNPRMLEGKPYLLTFWSTSCGPCLKEIPQLIALHRQFSAQGFSVIGIAASYDNLFSIEALRRSANIPYPIIHDEDGELVDKFGGIRATPTTFFVNADRKISKKVVGSRSLREKRKEILRMLNERDGAAEG